MSQFATCSPALRIASEPPEEVPAEKVFAAATSAAAERPKSGRLRLAVEEFFARRSRRGHPEGDWLDGLWYPSASERRRCCGGIRPTAGYPQALERHCRSQTHLAVLYEVPVRALKAAVREDRKQGSPIAKKVASSCVALRGQRSETFAELRRQTRAKAFGKLYQALAQGLPLLERLHATEGRPDTEHGQEMTPLLETAAECAERLLAAIYAAKRKEELMDMGGAFLAALQGDLGGEEDFSPPSLREPLPRSGTATRPHG